MSLRPWKGLKAVLRIAGAGPSAGHNELEALEGIESILTKNSRNASHTSRVPHEPVPWALCEEGSEAKPFSVPWKGLKGTLRRTSRW